MKVPPQRKLCELLRNRWAADQAHVLADWCEEHGLLPIAQALHLAAKHGPTHEAWRALNALAVCLGVDVPQLSVTSDFIPWEVPTPRRANRRVSDLPYAGRPNQGLGFPAFIPGGAGPYAAQGAGPYAAQGAGPPQAMPSVFAPIGLPYDSTSLPATLPIVPMPPVGRCQLAILDFDETVIAPDETFTLETGSPVPVKLLRILFSEESLALIVKDFRAHTQRITLTCHENIPARAVDGWDLTLPDWDLYSLPTNAPIRLVVRNDTDRPIVARIALRVLALVEW